MPCAGVLTLLYCKMKFTFLKDLVKFSKIMTDHFKENCMYNSNMTLFQILTYREWV